MRKPSACLPAKLDYPMPATGCPTRLEKPSRPARARFALFSDLGDDDLDRVMALGRTVAMEKGQIAIPQDTRCNEFYLILSGAFSFRKSSPSGLVFELGKASAGAFFGENILLAERPSEVEVSAVADASVCVFRASDFRNVLAQHPSIARRMLDELTARINRFANLSFELATMKLDVRLRKTIQDLARQANQLHDGGIIRPAPTHAELATMLGTTREVVSRSLILLSRNGAITTGRQQIHIRSVNLLCSEDGASALP